MAGIETYHHHAATEAEAAEAAAKQQQHDAECRAGFYWATNTQRQDGSRRDPNEQQMHEIEEFLQGCKG